jgi:ketosteroid isomerase-like protein
MTEPQATETTLKNWLHEMQACVRAVDYERAKKLFAPDVVGFGTYASVVQGLDNLQAGQWSNIWPTIRDFTFRLDELHWGVDGALAWAACSWDSTGFRPDGTPFPRPGRVTLVFERREERWLAVHSHFSLYPAR